MIKLFRTLILRPLLRDVLRTSLTLIAVALGVAVVIGIELAGDAASGSFQSSLTTIVGKTDLQISANGGLDENWIGKLAQLPLNVRFSPVIEAQVSIAHGGSATLYGVDAQGFAVSKALAERLRLKQGGSLVLRLSNGPRRFKIDRVVDARDSEFLAIDIAQAQQALNAYGKLDRIEATVGAHESFEKVEDTIRGMLPAGYMLDKPGARSHENQRMLRAFRWNLRVLSYISLVVGAFLIYNTISISVVRRRPEIGILRAIGAGRLAIFWVFLTEALIFGSLGAILGIAIGRVMAEGLVGLISVTVNSLYTSSRPAAISLTAGTAATAALTGLGVALASAFGPALAAMRVTPREAMSRGSRESRVRLRVWRNLAMATVLAALAYAAARQGPVDGSPLFGYAAVVLAIACAALLAPGLTVVVAALTKRSLKRTFGAEGLLAGRSLTASLGRSSIVVAALATAIAMMSSVGIMVGSFRETVVAWLDTQLRADIYLRAAGPAAPGVYPPLPGEVTARVEAVPGVDAVDVFSALEFRYQGQRSSLGGEDTEILSRYGRFRFLLGEDRDAILRSLKTEDRAIVTQAFANKHGLQQGDRIRIPLGGSAALLTIAGIYYDYTSERGFVIVDRATLLKHLPEQPATSLAIYLKPGVDRAKVLRAIRNATAQYPVDVAPNQALREGAVEIFDRTFAVTYALEGVAIIVAMLGAANSLLALVLDRRRELGLLRYLGAATSQIRRMILVEAGLLGFLANVLGLALGLALSLVLIYVINEQSFGWSIQFHPPFALLGSALLLVWCVTIVAGLYPARVASRLNPIDVIHEE